MSLKIACKVSGEGPPLVVLHGLFGSGDNWGSFSRKWSQNHKVFLLDLPNHGESGTLEDFTYPRIVQELEAWRESEIPSPVTLLGHSLGGKVVMEWALAYPDSVSTLVVADMTPRAYDNHLDKIIQLLLDTDLFTFSDRPSVRKYWESKLGDPILAAFLVKNVGDEGGLLSWKLRREQLWNHRKDLWAALETGRVYTGPTLFVGGADSSYIQVSDHNLMGEFFPQAEIRRVPKAGHWVQADNPSGFLEALENYISL